MNYLLPQFIVGLNLATDVVMVNWVFNGWFKHIFWMLFIIQVFWRRTHFNHVEDVVGFRVNLLLQRKVSNFCLIRRLVKLAQGPSYWLLGFHRRVLHKELMFHFLFNVKLRFLCGFGQPSHFRRNCQTKFSKTDPAVRVATHTPQNRIHHLFWNDRFLIKLVAVNFYGIRIEKPFLKWV